MKREYDLQPGEIFFLTDGKNTVGAIKAFKTRYIFIETEREELVQFLTEDDLIAASAFYAGGRAKAAIACMLYLVRDCGMPLLVLSPDHPATRRLPMVASAGERIRLTSCIVPGTHPEQDVLCGRGALDGVTLTGMPGGIAVEGQGGDVVAEARPCLFYKNIK